MTTSNQLLPCPFCGGSAAYQRLRDGSKYGAYECGECGAQGPDVRTGYGPEEEWRDKAIAAWNERSADTPPAAAHGDSRVDDLATLVRRLVRSLRKASPDNNLSDKALDYLNRAGLTASPLRIEGEEDPWMDPAVNKAWRRFQEYMGGEYDDVPPAAAHGDEVVQFEIADVVAVSREDLLAMSGDVCPSTGRSEMECLLAQWLKGHDIPVFRKRLYAMRAQGDVGEV